MKNYLRVPVLALSVMAGALFTLPASAATYLFTFQNDSTSANYPSYGNVVINGTFTTASATLPSSITGISGAVAGGNPLTILDGAIGGLSPYAASDNILYASGTTSTYSFGGVSFYVQNGMQRADYNLYWNGATFLLSSLVDSVGYASSGTEAGSVIIAVPSVVTPVPEPAIWAMLLLGFGAVGWTLRGNRRQRVLGLV